MSATFMPQAAEMRAKVNTMTPISARSRSPTIVSVSIERSSSLAPPEALICARSGLLSVGKALEVISALTQIVEVVRLLQHRSRRVHTGWRRFPVTSRDFRFEHLLLAAL